MRSRIKETAFENHLLRNNIWKSPFQKQRPTKLHTACRHRFNFAFSYFKTLKIFTKYPILTPSKLYFPLKNSRLPQKLWFCSQDLKFMKKKLSSQFTVRTSQACNELLPWWAWGRKTMPWKWKVLQQQENALKQENFSGLLHFAEISETSQFFSPPTF